MKLQFVTVHTAALEASIAFWERTLGFKTVRRFSPRPGMEIAFLDDGAGGQIEFIADGGEPYAGRGISLGFRADDMEAMAAKLREGGARVVSGPTTLPSGLVMLVALDPNGLELGFVREPTSR